MVRGAAVRERAGGGCGGEVDGEPRQPPQPCRPLVERQGIRGVRDGDGGGRSLGGARGLGARLGAVRTHGDARRRANDSRRSGGGNGGQLAAGGGRDSALAAGARDGGAGAAGVFQGGEGGGAAGGGRGAHAHHVQGRRESPRWLQLGRGLHGGRGVRRHVRDAHCRAVRVLRAGGGHARQGRAPVRLRDQLAPPLGPQLLPGEHGEGVHAGRAVCGRRRGRRACLLPLA
mmetsp:Transcript_14877/g.29873  ORF Transcript_14877/g.29873 Transcript_14877/m.29873 type:complete len:230 (+) Transcript_14877:3334-4023(+)